MLDEKVKAILDNIHMRERNRTEHLNNAKQSRGQEAAHAKTAKIQEDWAATEELEIDKLQLELRKALNGLESTIPVPLPAVDMGDQVGREG